MLDSGRAAVTGSPSSDADLTIRTRPHILQEILTGVRPGYEAFLDGDLEARGNIALALEMESLFDPLSERDPAAPLTIHPTIGRMRWSVLASGPPDGPAVMLFHGLGSSKISMLTLVRSLSDKCRVYACDLPGFGDSAKPIASYHAEWFTDHIVELMDALGIDEALFAGNSMGGRISLEMGLREPSRVTGLLLLCPAMAMLRMRQAVPIVRLLRSELGLLPLSPSRSRVIRTVQSLFARPEAVSDAWLQASADEFFRVYSKPRGRMAFYAAARSIYLDEPRGDNGLWTRLKTLDVPARFVFGRHDPLVPAVYAENVADELPDAEITVLDDAGHVPQLEFPDAMSDLARSMLT